MRIAFYMKNVIINENCMIIKKNFKLASAFLAIRFINRNYR